MNDHPLIPAPAGRRRWLAGLTATGLGLLTGAAQAQTATPTPPTPPAPMPPRMPGGPGMDERRAERMVSHLLDAAEASAEQRTRIVASARAAAADLRQLREQQRAARDTGMALLGAASIDRVAIELARVARQQLREQISRRTTQALVEAAEVLRPEQRTRVIERWREHDHGRGDGRGHGHGHGRRYGHGQGPAPAAGTAPKQ